MYLVPITDYEIDFDMISPWSENSTHENSTHANSTHENSTQRKFHPAKIPPSEN